MRKWPVLAVLLVMAHASCRADIPCPLKLIDGERTLDGIRLTFRNTGKLPIQEVDLDCTPLGGHGVRRSACRTETGLFYPGSQYDVSFQYGGVPGAVQLSLRAARLSDGTIWTATRHQACKPLKVLLKSSR